MEILLASQSPRRRELMTLVTPRFAVGVADFDEAGLSAESPAALAMGLARGKAAAAGAQNPGSLVIGCDTVVELDGAALGKPGDEAVAIDMLCRLAGHTHLVHTGVCLWLAGRETDSFVETTAVTFAPIPEKELLAYAKTAEPYDKAGAYGIQGWAARFVTRIEGCYYNVMGLPVAALYARLMALGAL